MSADRSLDVWTEILQLDGFRVVHVHHDAPTDPVRLTVIPTISVGVCPHCRHACERIHRRHESDLIQDLPLGAQAVALTIRLNQFECARCGHFFTPTSPVFVRGAHATERFLAQAARLIRFSDIANAAAFLGVAEKTLEKWYYAYVARQQEAPAAAAVPIRQLGIDELDLKKKASGSWR